VDVSPDLSDRNTATDICLTQPAKRVFLAAGNSAEQNRIVPIKLWLHDDMDRSVTYTTAEKMFQHLQYFLSRLPSGHRHASQFRGHLLRTGKIVNADNRHMSGDFDSQRPTSSFLCKIFKNQIRKFRELNLCEIALALFLFLR
jgi:hypothetical protein